MPEPGKLYCTRRDLEKIRLDCAAITIDIDESVMLLWTPAEAHEYFTSKGSVQPDAAVLAARSVGDKAPKQRGLKENEKDLLISTCCCCCDTLIEICRERRKKAVEQRRGEQQSSSGGAPPGQVQVMAHR